MQSGRSPICCTRCGEVGHNRRNRLCPLLRVAVAVEDPVAQRTKAKSLNKKTTEVLLSWDRGELSDIFQDVPEFVANVLATLIEIVNSFQIALKQFHMPDLLAEIELNVGMVNDLLSRHRIQAPDELYWLGEVCVIFNLPTNPVLKYRPYQRLLLTRFDFEPVPCYSILEDMIHEMMAPSYQYAHEDQPAPKLSSQYFKELPIQIISAPSGSNTNCPVCFEPLNAENALYAVCDHGHCVGCLKSMADSMKDTTKKPTCSLCREPFSKLSGRVDVCVEIHEHIRDAL